METLLLSKKRHRTYPQAGENTQCGSASVNAEMSVIAIKTTYCEDIQKVVGAVKEHQRAKNTPISRTDNIRAAYTEYGKG